MSDVPPTPWPGSNPNKRNDEPPREAKSSKNRSVPGAGAEQFAELFHATYERLAPEFGYTTRTDTRRFDRGSHNGKLMIAVCDYLLTWLDEGAPAEIERLRAFITQWTYEGSLQTFEDRARFRTEAQRLLAAAAPESRDG